MDLVNNHQKKSFLTKIITALMITLFTVTVHAGQDVWTDTQLAPGIKWRNKIYTSLYGGKQTVNVIEIDLNNPQVLVKPIRSTSGCARTSVMANSLGAVGAINGGYFDGSCNSLSMVKIDDTVYSTNPGFRPARSTIGIDQTNGSYFIQRIASTDPWSAVDDALGAGPNLVTNGSADITRAAEGFDPSFENRNPRSAVGITGSNQLLMVTVDGRTSAGIGMTLNNLASYMIALGCDRAMNLDGGGSTTLWTDSNGVVNTPSDGFERSVVSALGVYSVPAPVDGIIIDNADSEYSETGSFGTSVSSGFYGTNSRYAGVISSQTRTATWAPNLPDTGTYEIYAWWVAGSNRSPGANYIINHAGGSSSVSANQQSNGSQWNLLGTYSMNSGTSHNVQLTNVNSLNGGNSGAVISADAIRFRFISPPEVVVDNEDSDFNASSNWWTSSSTSGYIGNNYRVRPTASTSDAATWQATLADSGNYEVFVNYSSGSNRASAAPYIVYHNGGSTTVQVNQQTNGGQWVSLGTFNMNAGTSTRVALSCWTSSGTYVVADAVRFVKQ